MRKSPKILVALLSIITFGVLMALRFEIHNIFGRALFGATAFLILGVCFRRYVRQN
jgi:hypothetical protein